MMKAPKKTEAQFSPRPEWLEESEDSAGNTATQVTAQKELLDFREVFQDIFRFIEKMMRMFHGEHENRSWEAFQARDEKAAAEAAKLAAQENNEPAPEPQIGGRPLSDTAELDDKPVSRWRPEEVSAEAHSMEVASATARAAFNMDIQTYGPMLEQGVAITAEPPIELAEKPKTPEEIPTGPIDFVGPPTPLGKAG